ncbi:hypothetical protein N7G274_004251 [Stereocaulon virgatum]|uniref:Uncharacterized protein n=1 Tax=Stereocaulon virgatum TaxID=373712 RepID=A0ABR4AED0_9LECA
MKHKAPFHAKCGAFFGGGGEVFPLPEIITSDLSRSGPFRSHLKLRTDRQKPRHHLMACRTPSGTKKNLPIRAFGNFAKAGISKKSVISINNLTLHTHVFCAMLCKKRLGDPSSYLLI